MNAFFGNLELFADNASFLWQLRSIAVNQPHYTHEDILELDARIDAQLNGLMVLPEESWAICEQAMALEQPGDIFVAAVVAFRSLDVTKIQAAVEAGLANADAIPGLISALGWLPGRLVHSWIKKFLTSKDLSHKYLAVAACSIRQENPQDYLSAILAREDCRAHENLYARSLQTAGELKRFDLLPHIRLAIKSDSPKVKFWALWSGVLLGDPHLAADLKPYVMQPSEFQREAINLCFRVLPSAQAYEWITELVKDPKQLRSAIAAIGVLGDPKAIDWLIGQMQEPKLSRLAGEIFSSITGIALEENNLALDALPDLTEQLPGSDESEDGLEVDEDEYLPFPDVNKIGATWQKYRNRFAVGSRYLLGKNITQQHLQDVLENGKQRHRRAAALELALENSAQYLINHALRDAGHE